MPAAASGHQRAQQRRWRRQQSLAAIAIDRSVSANCRPLTSLHPPPSPRLLRSPPARRSGTHPAGLPSQATAAMTQEEENERNAQKAYWKEHSGEATVEAMMLDSKAADIDKLERPEVGRCGRGDGGRRSPARSIFCGLACGLPNRVPCTSPMPGAQAVGDHGWAAPGGAGCGHWQVRPSSGGRRRQAAEAGGREQVHRC